MMMGIIHKRALELGLESSTSSVGGGVANDLGVGVGVGESSTRARTFPFGVGLALGLGVGEEAGWDLIMRVCLQLLEKAELVSRRRHSTFIVPVLV